MRPPAFFLAEAFETCLFLKSFYWVFKLKLPMLMKYLQTLTLLGALLLVPALLHAQNATGTIQALSVVGNVTLTDANGNSGPLYPGSDFTEGHTLTTGPASSALIAFSNGSSLRLSENTTLRVDTFRQAAFDESQGTFLQLEADPSQSRTELWVEAGQVAGNVRKLRSDSTFNVNTPGGTAAIRGTDYVVTVVIRGGEAFTSITNASGDVVAIIQGNPVGVPPGQSVEIQANRTVDAQGQVTYTITEVGTPVPATGQEIAAANQAINDIQQVRQQPRGPGGTPAGEVAQGVPFQQGGVPGAAGGTTPPVDVDAEIDFSPAGG